jgi:ABC-type transporter Mla MlaB component
MHIDGNGAGCNTMNAADGLAQPGISGEVNRNALVAAAEEVAEARHRVLVLAAQVTKLDQEKCELLVTLEEVKRKLQAITTQAISLETQVLHRDRQLALIFNSTSWLLTRPIRFVGRLLRG